MMASSTAGSPRVEVPRASILPAAFTFEIRPLPLMRRTAVPAAQGRTASRFSKTEKFIAIAAGATLGFVLGGGIGFALTSEGPSDDVGGLRGVVIGAPLGAVIGGFIGYRLTK